MTVKYANIAARTNNFNELLKLFQNRGLATPIYQSFRNSMEQRYLTS